MEIGKMKKLSKWVPPELTKNEKKKKKSFSSVTFSYPMQQQQTIS